MRRGVGLVLFIGAALAACALGQTPASQPATRATQQVQPNPLLNHVEELLTAHRWKPAHDLLVPWLTKHPQAPDRDRALFLLAEVYYQNGDRIRAFYHLDELMDNYPESRLFFPALERQYDIADAYLNGYKMPLPILGWRILSAEDEAIEMLYRIQERSPGSPLAERSLKRTADYYFNSSQFDLAGDAYAAFIRSYPRSPDIPRVKLRQAFSSLAQFHGPKYDSTPLIDARAEFRDVQARYPELAAESNVPQWIDKIEADLARKAYETGDFYRRTGKPGGAAFMYRYLMENYPNSREAQLARRDLARLPAWAQRRPAPPAGTSGEEAATRPSQELNPSPRRGNPGVK